MDTLVPAFVAALLAGAGDRPAWLAAMLADRHRGGIAVVLGLGLAFIVAYGFAAVAGSVIGARLTPEARALLVALALASAGVGCLLRTRAPRPIGASAGAFGAALIGGLALVIGDSAGFLVFALAARGPSAGLAAAGGIAAGIMLAAVAVQAGEASWIRLPRRAIGLIGGALFLVAAAVIGFSALRLL